MAHETLERETEEAIVLYEKAIGRPASRTRTMIESHGTVDALSRLILSADLQKGFKVLRDTGQLAVTFKALVVRHTDKFGREVVEAAQWRLDHPHQLL